MCFCCGKNRKSCKLCFGCAAKTDPSVLSIDGSEIQQHPVNHCIDLTSMGASFSDCSESRTLTSDHELSDLTSCLKDIYFLVEMMLDKEEYSYTSQSTKNPVCDEEVRWLPCLIWRWELVERRRNSATYRAVHINARSKALIKVGNSRNFKKYVQEQEIWTALKKHPYILGLIGEFHNDVRRCLVGECADGGSLKYVIEINKPLSIQVVRIIAAQLCSAVLYIHKNGVFHRDLRSKNIFLTTDGIIKINDFGSATTQKYCQGIHGSWFYTAPEAFEGIRYDCCSDWYAVGVCIYEMLMGITPLEFHCRKEKIVFPKLEFKGRLVVTLTMKIYIVNTFGDATTSILTQFLEKDPSKRLGKEDSIQQISDQPFFKNIDWNKVESGALYAPLQKRYN